MHRRHAAILLCALCASVAAFAATLDASLIQTIGQPFVGSGKFYGYRTAAEGPGNNAFSNAYEKAVSEGVPLVVVWSNEGCEHCDAFIEELNANIAEVSQWLASKDAVFTFFKDYSKDDRGRDAVPEEGHEPKACYDAWHFASKICYAKTSWPLFAFHYLQGNGSRVTWGTESNLGGTTRTWQKFKENYENWIERNGITRYRGGAFAASGGAFDRYEAEPSTEYIYVELVRDADKGGYAYTNRLEAVWPGESVARVTNMVEWAVSETSKTVRVSLQRNGDEEFKEGQIVLKLLDSNGGVKHTTPVVCFKSVPNSAANPLWIAERDVDTLAFAEWTCDIDTATNKVAALAGAGTEAWTLVYTLGSQWCPYCYLNGKSFIDTDTFVQWARDNNVFLVSVDYPHRSDDKPDVDYGTIWNRKPDSTNLYFDGLGGTQTRSGRGFLSRKMVSEDEASAMRAKLIDMGRGFFHLPEDYQAARPIIPGLSLLDASGRVVGRFETFDYDMNMNTNGAKAALFCRRLSEMIESARSSEDRAFENKNDNCATTTATLPVYARAGEANSRKGTISHADYRDVYRIDGALPGVQARFVCSGERAAQTRLCLLKGDASGNIADLVVTVTNLLSQSLVIDTAKIPGFAFESGATYFVRVASHSIMPKTSSNYRPYRLRWGDGDDGFSRDYAADYDGSTLTEYELSAEALCVPMEQVNSMYVPDGCRISMAVTKGETYRLTGCDRDRIPAGLSPVEGGIDGLYRCTSDDETVVLYARDGGGAVEYQLWHPGKVEFAKSEQTVYTHMGDAVLTVSRTGGVSGRLAETVRLMESDEHAAGRYSWKDGEVVWEDGESGSKDIVLGIVPPSTLHSAGTLLFGVGDSRLSVMLLDTDSPGLELMEYAESTYRYFSSGLTFGTVNLKGENYVSVRVLSGSIPPGTRLNYDAESGNVELLGEPVSEGDYEFTVALAEIRDGRYVVGPASTIRVKVEQTDERNAYLTKARANETLPLYADRGGTNFIAGTLSIAITSHGKISARYMGTEARTAVFSGAWRELDEEDTARARLVKGACTLDLAMDTNGVLSAELQVSPEYSCFARPEGLALNATAAWPEGDPLDEYAGIYNVALPIESCSSRPDAPSGTGILTLRMPPGTAAQAGRFAYSGFMPDGTPLNGSATATRVVEYGREFIRIPIFRRVGRNVFSATLTIEPEAALKWDSPDDPRAREVVHLADGTMALSVHRDAAWEYELVHNMAVGSYYLPGVSSLELSETFYTNLYARPIIHILRFSADGMESPAFGSLSVPEADIVPSGDTMSLASSVKGLTFAFKARTGLFSGSAVVTFTDESGKKKKVTGSYRGLLTPGWVRNCDCGDTVPEWYFGSGFLRYRDFNASGRAVIKSIPLMLSPHQDFE